VPRKRAIISTIQADRHREFCNPAPGWRASRKSAASKAAVDKAEASLGVDAACDSTRPTATPPASRDRRDVKERPAPRYPPVQRRWRSGVPTPECARLKACDTSTISYLRARRWISSIAPSSSSVSPTLTIKIIELAPMFWFRRCTAEVPNAIAPPQTQAPSVRPPICSPV